MKDYDGNRIIVQTDGNRGPYIVVLCARVDELRKALSDAGIGSVPRDNVIVLDDQSRDCAIDLGIGADKGKAQEVLDSIE